MSFETLAVTVLIASPGDTVNARDAVETAVASWNRDRSRSQKVVLLPLRWETDAVPSMGSDPQAVINRQIVDTADIVVALFHSRLGAPTPRSPSGTAEEIDSAKERGVPVYVFFSEMPLPRSVDPDELKRLNEFRALLRDQGLLGSYASIEDLTAKVRTALESDLGAIIDSRQRQVVASQPSKYDTGATGHAILRAQYVHEGTARDCLILENLGSSAAKDVTLDLESVGRRRCSRSAARYADPALAARFFGRYSSGRYFWNHFTARSKKSLARGHGYIRGGLERNSFLS